ncbi:MAG: LysE family translocator [Chloroflexota bacterium]|nr:LysE family translocator [Chloroflexota bacterium]
MPTTPTLMAFALAAIVLVAIPGPNLIYIITRGIHQGPRAAIVSSLGVQAGMVVHVVLAALGLGAVIASSPLLYDALRYAGAGYLIWMGIGLIRRRGVMEAADVKVQRASMRRLFLHGMVINLLNPKVILFVLALLPQFVDPARGSTVTQMLALGSVLIVVALISDSLYALASGSVGSWLRRHPESSRHSDRISGLVYLALGLIVALAGSGSAQSA